MLWKKIKTAFIVLLLSCLVWIFAERAVTQEVTAEVTLKLPEKPDDVLVQFLDETGKVLPISRKKVTLTVRGPARRILSINDYTRDRVLDYQQIGVEPAAGESKDSWEKVSNLLGGQLESSDGSSVLQITRSDPPSLHLRVTRLVRQLVPVKVYDSNGLELTAESITPDRVEAYILKGQPAEARVTLTEIEQQHASQTDTEFPVRIAPPNRINAATVRVKLSQSGHLRTETIRSPRLEIYKPFSMEGRFKVVLEDESQLDEPIECRGTPTALEQFKKGYQLILTIYEEDQNKLSPQVILRPISYNLPVGLGPIEIINKKQVPIRFRLVKLPG